MLTRALSADQIDEKCYSWANLYKCNRKREWTLMHHFNSSYSSKAALPAFGTRGAPNLVGKANSPVLSDCPTQVAEVEARAVGIIGVRFQASALAALQEVRYV